jgi:hypothetical protein
MKTTLILIFFLACTDIFSQCITPDTTKIPLSRYNNSYAYFTGNDTGCFLRTRYFSELALNYENLDSFSIEWRMKLRHSDSTQHRYIFGLYDSTNNDGWFVSFNMANVYDPSDPDAGYLEFYTDTTGLRKLYRIGFSDSNWYTYNITYSKSSSILTFTVDGTLQYVDSNYNHGWDLADQTVYTFAVGFNYQLNFWGIPSYIPLSPYYFKGYIDFLKITYKNIVTAGPNIFNWSFNDGAGQYVRDSSDYKIYEYSTPDWPSAHIGKHLQSGCLGAQEKYDIVWFNESTGSAVPPFSDLNNGVRAWVGNWVVTGIGGVGEWNGGLAVIGAFNRVNAYNLSVDDGNEANHIAVWYPNNDPPWVTLGDGLNMTGRDVISYNGDLIATGLFTYSGKVQVNHIAKWDGQSWSALGDGLEKAAGTSDPWGYVLKVWDDNLYVCGNFLNAGGDTANRIARWDGSNWYSFNLGLSPNNVWDMEMYHGNLYAGGSFNHAVYEDFYFRGIMKWNGTDWDSVGTTGLDGTGTIRALCVYNDDLYAAGDFVTVDDVTCNGIAKYNDGTEQWSALGNGGGIEGFGKNIADLYVYNNELYITGSFYYMDGIPVNKICKWDGSQFCAISNGLDENAIKMTVYNNQLIVAGNFFSADGQNFNNILRYSDNGDVSRTTAKTFISPNLNQNYPNPFNPKTTIKYSIPVKGLVTLKIYDILGREVKTLVNEIKEAGTYFAEFDASNYASGVYIYKLTAGDYEKTVKMVLLK